MHDTVPHRSPLWSRLDRLAWSAALLALGGVALLLLVAPTVVVLITSFTSSAALRFPPPGYSLQWYVALLTDSPEIVAAAVVSLQVAAAATALSCLLSVPAALAISGSRAGWARAADSLLMSPLLLPSLALGLGLLLTLNLAAIGVSRATLIIGHGVICFPYVLRTTIASLAGLDPALHESSRSLGARPWFTFRRVTLPLIRGGILAGGFLAFMASFDNVAISLFLADARSEVLPIRLWNLIENLLDVRAAAVSGVLIGVTTLLALVMERATNLSRHLR